MTTKIKYSEFLEEAKRIHNNFYDYSLVTNYRNSSSRITIICPTHGKFDQEAFWHMRGHKCKKCGYEQAGNKRRKHPIGYIRYVPNGTIAKTLNDYILKFNKKHNNKYDYSLLSDSDLLIKTMTKGENFIKIICPMHGKFEQKFNLHLDGNGCQQCKKAAISAASQPKYTKNKWVDACNKVHNYFYNYDKSVFTNLNDKINICCPKHGIFMQKAKYHKAGAGCRECAKGKTSSKLGNKWLDSLQNDSIIREHKIILDNKNYVVDGFDQSTNTIYEFFGDYWHANPDVFNLDDIMVKRKVTFRSIYEKTINRILLFKNKGFNVTYIWEKEFLNSIHRQVKCRRGQPSL